MIGFIYGLAIGVALAYFVAWRLGRVIQSERRMTEDWMVRAFTAIEYAERALRLVPKQNLAAFDRTANEIASLPEIEK